MKSLLLSFLFCSIAALAVPPCSIASTTDAPAAAAAEDVEDADSETADWVRKLDDAKLRLDLAQRELGELTNAKGRGAARRYPRGDAKAKFLESLTKAHAEYEAARAALPDVIEDARRAGVSPGVLDPYAAAAEASAPPASADESASDEDANDDDAESDAASD